MDVLLVATLDYDGCELSSSYTARVDSHAVLLDAETFVGVMAIDYGCAVVLGKLFLEFVPWLHVTLLALLLQRQKRQKKKIQRG